MNGDYMPLDGEVIDQAVEALEKERTEARETLRGALKNAEGNIDIVVFPRKDYNKFRSIIKALDLLGIFWCETNGEIYINRHEVEFYGDENE